MAKSERFGIPTRQEDTLLYAGEGINAVPTVHAQRDPTILDRKYPMQTIWRNDVTLDEWMHLDTINGDAIWRKLMGAAGATTTISDTADTVVSPDITGNIQLVAGAGVAITSDPVNNLLTVALSGGGGAADSFTTDDGAPAVVPDGAGNVNVLGSPGISVTGQGPGNTITVALVGGGLAVDSIQVDDFLAPGTQPVVPSNAGLVIVTGDQVANGAIAVPAQAIQTKSLTVNTYTTQIQQGAAATPAAHTIAHNGICSFDSTMFTVTNGYVQSIGSFAAGSSNIGIAYAAGTFTVQGANGTALSAANPGYVTLQSKSVPGRLVTIPVTANQTFTDGAAGTIDNQRFDFVTGVNWSNDMPFYLYAVSHDNENAIAFGVSRGPCFSVSPGAASIGKTGAVVNVGQSDFFLLGNPTVAEYDANPCIPLGSFRMQFVGATDSWTVSALKTTDGVGQWHDSTIWTMPAGVNGATAGTFFQAVGGTQIIFATQVVRYRLTRTGLCSYYFLGENCTQAGVGENPARLTLPYQPYLTSQRISTAYYSPSGGANNVFWSYMTNNSYYVVFNALGAGSVAINQSAWDLGAATTLDTGFVYPVFGELP